MKFWTNKQRKQAGNALLVVLLTCIVYSGFAYPLNYGAGLWPWNRDWFMFSADGGSDCELRPTAESQEGTPLTLDVSPYFKFVVGINGNRFQEVTRDEDSMRALAKFLCTKFPVRWVTIQDLCWQRPAGRRLTIKEIPNDQLDITTWVEHYQCSGS